MASSVAELKAIPSRLYRSFGPALVGAVAFAFATTALADPVWDKVGEAFGKAGTEMPGGVYRIALPRTDIKATLDGVELKPGFALGGWLAFQKMEDTAMVMGDLVLTQDEVNPVMAKLLAGGIEVTALHNHLLRNTPFTMYMHVYGRGDPVKLATALHAGLAESKTPMTVAAPRRHHHRPISTRLRSTKSSARRAPITAASMGTAFDGPTRSMTAA